MSYAPSATNISAGDQTKVIRGLDAFATIGGIAVGFIDTLVFRPKNPIVAYQVGQPAQTVFLQRDEQGFEFTLGLAQLGSQQLGWGVGQTISTVSGSPYTVLRSAPAGIFTFSPSQVDSEGNEYIQLPDGLLTSVSVYSAPTAGTTYSLTTDYLIEAGAVGKPGQIVRVGSGGITASETVYVTFTATPVAASFVNVGLGTPLNANAPCVIKFRESRSGNINYYQHSQINLAAGPNAYMWDLKAKSWQSSSLTMEALPDYTQLDPGGNPAPFGFMYIPT